MIPGGRLYHYLVRLSNVQCSAVESSPVQVPSLEGRSYRPLSLVRSSLVL